MLTYVAFVEVCDAIGDGIMKLREGVKLWQYVPGLEWRAVQENMGGSRLYDDLVPVEHVKRQDGPERDPHAHLLQIVCRVLDLKAEEVSFDVPLTTYGLDSLSAAALSFALRSLFAISQVQLLADMTIADLDSRLIQ